MNINDVKNYLLQLQEQLCSELEGFEKGKKFQQETWQYAQGGGGRSRVLEQGKVFEKAGVNFSHVQGNSLPASATASRPHLQGKSFQALGVSLVMHPLNPYVPTTHMNVRLFCTGENEKEPIWWFGGGFDLTPYYPFYEDVIHWHQTAKQACDEFDKNYYPRFKKCCDEYFYLKHRNETRGVGGLFFDDFNELDFEQSFAFMRSIGDAFIPAYLPIIEKRKEIEFQERQKQFQCYRRGRYVEFNLVFDRGTLFGLQSGGRTESILMSMPPQANWVYGWTPEPGSPEADLYDNYLQPRDWLKCGE